MMHQAVEYFIEKFEKEAALNGSYRKKLGRNEIIFLEEVLGPVVQYDFSGVHAEYPFKDFKGGDRFADFICVKNGMRLLIEIDDFSTHA